MHTDNNKKQNKPYPLTLILTLDLNTETLLHSKVSLHFQNTPCNALPLSPSLFSFLPSEPCPPTGVSSFMNCLSNIAVVSWNNSAGAEFYTATVTQKDGQSASCWSDSKQCGIPNVRCGQNYTVTVIGSREKCNSDPSKALTLLSGETFRTIVSSYYPLYIL